MKRGKLNYYLLILIIILGLSFLIFNVGKFTGKATDSIVNITINPRVQINFTLDNIDFGRGNVNAGQQNATIDTLGNIINGNWTPVTTGFRIENLGNVNVSVDLKTGQDAANFLGGGSPGYLYNVTNAESGSCVSSIVLGEWYDVNTSDPGTRICDVLGYETAVDSIDIDVRLIIPTDSKKGALTDTFTATATVAS